MNGFLLPWFIYKEHRLTALWTENLIGDKRTFMIAEKTFQVIHEIALISFLSLSEATVLVKKNDNRAVICPKFRDRLK
jgi:hypothetical protein